MNIKKKTKVTAAERIRAAVTDSYDFTDRVKFGKNRYRIMYTGVNTEASAESMFNDFRFQISVSNPYDDADYAWCYGDRGVIKIIKSQKVIHKAFYFNADDMDVENTEWCDEVVRIALSELEKINGRIEQRIIHNSRKISADATVEAATFKNDRRLSTTSERYKGYLIVLDRGGDGYNVYDKHRELEDAGYPSREAAKKFIDELVSEAGNKIESSVDIDEETEDPGIAEAFIRTNVNDCSNVTASLNYVTPEMKQLKRAVSKISVDNDDQFHELVDSLLINEPINLVPETRALKRAIDSLVVDSEEERRTLVYEVAKDLGVINSSSNVDVYSADDTGDMYDDEDDIKTVDQEYDSANTSINSTKLPAIYNMVNFPRGAVVLDYGGGKFDNAVEYLESIGCKGYVYDPYNRSADHNREVIKTIRANGGADITLCSNVLNVIKEPEARQNVLENIKKLTKPSGKVYITVYEGRGDGAEGPTKSGYQLNRKTAGYVDEVKEVFPEASRKGKLICASYQAKLEPIKQSCKVSPKHIKSSRNETLLPEKVDWYELDWDQQIQVMKRYIRNYKGTRIFEDFADYINKPVEDIIDSFCDAESYGDIKIPERKQLDSEYRNDDIYSSLQKDGFEKIEASDTSYIKNSENDHDFYFEPNKNSIINAIMFGMSLSRKVATIIYNWYDAEDAFDDFDSIVDMVEFIKSDIYDMLDACTNTKEKNLVYRALRQANDMTDVDDPITSSTKSTNYGGAYDVDPEQYFTREDLVEFADDVISCIANSQDILFDVSELYIEGNNITLGLTNTNNGGGFDHTVTFTVDMRKIRNPWDLQTKYSQKIANMFIDEYNKAISEDEIYSSKQPNSKLNQIRDKITKVVKNVMMFEAGFSEDEVEEYSVVEVDPSGKVEVRAEVDYDGLMSLCDALNPIVQRYDKDSYFEPVQPGIIQAWVNTQNDVIESSTTSSSGYWYFTRHGVQPGSVPKYVNILDIVDKPEGSYFLADGVILTNDLRDYDIKERKPEDSVTSSTRIKSKGNDQYTDADLQNIAEKIEAVVVAVIMQDEGFDESEAKMYSRVTISDIDDNGLYIEVGAEVSYESLERICSECDKVIQALPGVDENSYFEPIEPGLAGCYVYSK